MFVFTCPYKLITVTIVVANLSLTLTACNALTPLACTTAPAVATRTRVSYADTNTELFGCAHSSTSSSNSDGGGLTRRSASASVIHSIFTIGSVCTAVTAGTGMTHPVRVYATTGTATDEKKNDAEAAAAAAAAKERMKQRIADSKTNYRKSTDLVKQRKDTTDYSCVSDTGSPCPEGLVPRAIQREIIGAIEKK